MATKKIGILFGQEDTFPWAVMNEINTMAKANGDDIEAGPVQIGHLQQEKGFDYAVILDRISHEVPFYRTFLKCAVARGVQVINNPYWWSADDKYFDNIVALAAGVAVPKTVLLPHKDFPPNTAEKSFRNMKYVDWEDVFNYLGFPIFLKPAYGGGWKDVYKCDDRDAFFAAYDQTRDLTMMAQEAIDFTDYYRCYVLGRRRVRIMGYAPKEPHHLRYEAAKGKAVPAAMVERVTRDSMALCEALGYDMNTVEFAVRDGIPYAIDFMNCAPDADVHSVGQENFNWVVRAMAELLIERAKNPRPYEATGNWPSLLELAPAVPAAPAPASASEKPAKSSAGTRVAARRKPTPAAASPVKKAGKDKKKR